MTIIYTMAMLGKLKKLATFFRKEYKVYRLVIADRRTPTIVKLIYGLVIVYAVSPIDLIPDYIPILGQLDDAVIIPILLFIARQLTPTDVMEESKRKVFGTL